MQTTLPVSTHPSVTVGAIPTASCGGGAHDPEIGLGGMLWCASCGTELCGECDAGGCEACHGTGEAM